MKRAPHLLLLLLLPLLAGCFGAQGVPLPAAKRGDLRTTLEALDRLSHSQVVEYQSGLEEQIKQAGNPKEAALRRELEKSILLVGYCWERRADTDPGAFDEALRWYGRITGGGGVGCGRRPSSEEYSASGSIYSSVGHVRIAQIAEYRVGQGELKGEDTSATAAERQDALEIAVEQRKRARGALERAANYPVQADPATGSIRGPLVLVREPAVGSLPLEEWQQVDIRHAAYKRLDRYYRDTASYRIFDFLVGVCGGARKKTSYVLAILLIAVLAKLVTTPLSAAQFRSMQAMQAVQPEIKKIQEKYKGDKQQLARAQMELFKEHKVNPAASCLPMLIQMPILIWVYYGIRHFVFRFENVGFLYLHSLAEPDVLLVHGALVPGPLLLLYGVSMYVSQKLIATPAATPEQQQQQKLMAYMMPVLLVVILKALPAAFILYWFLQNLLMTGHQYLIMRSRRVAEVPAAPGSDTPAPSAVPPAEAIEELSQGTRRHKKKRKRK